MQVIRGCRIMMSWLGHIQEVTVDVVLQDESGGVEPMAKYIFISGFGSDTPPSSLPIIEYLAPHDMPSNSPAVLIALVSQPVMSKHLSVKIMRLKRGVMHMHLRSLNSFVRS
jgi:hypothetical protein